MKQEVDLIQYLPGFLQEIKEFQKLSQSENPEYELLYENIDTLLKNAFISTANLQGIKRWENLLKIAPSKAEPDERRAAILGKWNRTIPYTITRLYEYLDVLAARSDYHIVVFPSKYQLELMAEDLPLHTMRAMRSLVKAMLPANMLFILADRIFNEIPVPVDVQAELRMRSEFYPRYNVLPFLLDGRARLDGTYYLNGYLSGETLDFYPVVLRIRAETDWRKGAAGTVQAQLCFRPWVQMNMQNDADLKLWGAVCVKAQTASRFFLQGSADAGTQTSGQLTMQGTAEEYMGAETSPQIIAGAEMEISQESALQIGITARNACGMEAVGSLVIEKDLWRLDGRVMLDGSRLLDAEIYTEEI